MSQTPPRRPKRRGRKSTHSPDVHIEGAAYRVLTHAGYDVRLSTRTINERLAKRGVFAGNLTATLKASKRIDHDPIRHRGDQYQWYVPAPR